MKLNLKPTNLKNYFIIVLVSIIVFGQSCTNKSKNISLPNGQNYTTGNVYNNEFVDSAKRISVAMYLPKGLSAKSKMPVIYFFDPQGNGALPIELYKTIADKHGYILIGSNNIRNGLQQNELNEAFLATVLFVNNQLPIDKKRQFTAGFSGGAKLAMLYASQYSDIIGAIACGGSMPILNSVKPGYYYAGIVGNADFNYLECRQTFNVFEKYGFDYTAVTFDGKHEWPPLNYFELAVNGLTMYSVKMKLLDINEKWADNLYKQLTDSVTLYGQNNRLIDKYETLQQINRWFYGVKSISDIKKQTGILQNDAQFIAQMRNKQTMVQTEIALRSDYIRALGNKDFEWWKTEIENFGKDNPSNSEQNLVKKRLLSYLSMVTYSLAKTDLDELNFDGALNKIKVYQLVDPQNPDVYLTYARYYMLNSDTESMKTNYKKAVELGFNTPQLYANDIAWRQLIELNK